MNLIILFIFFLIVISFCFYLLGKKQKENEILKQIKFNNEKDNTNDINVVRDKLQNGKF